MGMPAAKQGDQIIGTDIHIIMVPAPPGPPVPTPIPHPFIGIINGSLSSDVKIMGQPAAVLGSKGKNNPPHLPLAPGNFQKSPTNEGTIMKGSATVMINGKPAARMGDTALTCNDPVDLPSGSVIAAGTVLIGG
ncbi:MAG TPA: PAAR domain-containing protein [Chloroflexota bacterium]|nr:PAAR domain-containing protein [Chloroflexota bacterium]